MTDKKAGPSATPEARAWMVWCPPRDECDYRVFFTKTDAEVFDDECRCSDDDAEHRTQGVIELVERASGTASMAAEVKQLRGALETELRRLDRINDGRTHIMGIDCDHPSCAAARRIRAALTPTAEGASK